MKHKQTFNSSSADFLWFGSLTKHSFRKSLNSGDLENTGQSQFISVVLRDGTTWRDSEGEVVGSWESA